MVTPATSSSSSTPLGDWFAQKVAAFESIAPELLIGAVALYLWATPKKGRRR